MLAVIRLLMMLAMYPSAQTTASRALSGETTDVRFVVLAPDSDQSDPQTLYVSFSLDGWPADGRALGRIADGLYSGTWTLPVGRTIEYKFLRKASWNTVEKDAAGRELPNRSLTVRGDVAEQVVFHAVARWADGEAGASRAYEFSETDEGSAAARTSTLTGDIRFHERFRSPQLDNERTLIIYLPPGYDEHTAQRYPVLYLHDGQNLFDAKTAFAGVEWRADETAQRLIKSGKITPLIIVGIYNTPDRVEEYTPVRDAKRGGGRGDRYLDFIASNVKPFIDKTYRTKPGRRDTALGGSSLGGLISLHALLKHSDVFGKAAAISPSLWWADRSLLDRVRKAELKRPFRLWLDMEAPRGFNRAAPSNYTGELRDAHDLVEILRRKTLPDDSAFHFEPVEGARHHERDWAARFDRVLLYLFGKDDS